ncbi:MAG: hypothetical protein BWX72_00462 [Firmicutes bacterium ADurb.Bin080]|nr:MAG: hypothetical protein BWX72_00462 [Firmicutes bacterium ADurb.Bin080]
MRPKKILSIVLIFIFSLTYLTSVLAGLQRCLLYAVWNNDGAQSN